MTKKSISIIKESEKKVKSLSTEREFLRVLSTLPEWREYFDNSSFGFCGKEWAYRLGDVKQGCGLAVPAHLTAPDKYLAAGKKKRIPLSERYPKAYAAMERSDMSSKTANVMVEEWSKRLCAISIKDEKGITFIPPNSKGTTRYQTKMYYRIWDWTQKADFRYPCAYFFTGTVSPSLLKGNTRTRWQTLAQEVSKFTKAFKKEFGTECVSVLESTAKGEPHVHMILYFDSFFQDDKQRYSPKQKRNYVYAGFFRRWIERHWKIGFADLQRNEKEGTENYLTKYINKANLSYIGGLLKKKRLTKTDLKAVFSLLCPVIAGVRGFRLSSGNTFREELPPRLAELAKREVKNNSSSVVDKTDYASASVSNDAKRRYLIKLSDNLPAYCRGEIRVQSYFPFMETGVDCDSVNLGGTAEEKEKIHSNGQQLGCGGCVVREWLAAMRRGEFGVTPESLNYPTRDTYVSKREREDDELMKPFMFMGCPAQIIHLHCSAK